MSTKNADLSALRIDSSKRDNSDSGGKSRKPVYLVIFLAFLVIITFYFLGFADNLFSSPVEVRLTSATVQSTSQANAILTASGYVVAQRKAAVASKGMGRLVYLGVVEGDRVDKNQVIARLESQDMQAQLDEVIANLNVQEAELKVAETNFKRQKALFKQQLASELDVDNAESNYDRVLALIELAKARIRAAEVGVENTVIRAPFAGTVLTKNADVGEIVAPLAAGVNSRAAVVTIADMTSLQVETDVSESNIQKIVTGLDCEITLDAYPSKRYAGFVSKIVPTADRAKATVMVKVGFKDYDDQVLPEMSAKVYFIAKTEQAGDTNDESILVIPQSALSVINGQSLVYKVTGETATAVNVSTGQKYGTYIEILQGLKNGDQIINYIDNKISNGIKVTVK